MSPVALFMPLLMVVQAVLFFAPGVVVGLWLYRKKHMRLLYVLPVAAVVGGLIGYATFLLYIVHPLIGEWVSAAILLASLLAAIYLLTNHSARLAFKLPDFLLPFALMLSVAVFYNAANLSCQSVGTTQSCYTQHLPWDNILQQMFANNVAANKPKELMGDWQGSDRPPLQAGVVLAQGPLTNSHYVGLDGYQLLSSLLQCLWIPAVWILGRLLGLSAARLALLVGLLATSGFFFFNSIFVWPKLIDVGFGVLALCLIFFEKPRRLYWGIAAAAAAAGFLSHSGVVFTLAPMALLLLHPRFWPGWRVALPSAVIAIAIVAPWFAYQKFYDPPGDRLAKWHLAGAIAIDDRPFLKTLTDAYTTTPLSEIVSNKTTNLQELVWGTFPPEGSFGPGKLAAVRDVTTRWVLPSFVLLNIGWFMLCFASLRVRIAAVMHADRLALLLGIGAGTLILWALTLFGPFGTDIYSGSYLTFTLLFVCAAAMITALPKRFALILSVAHLAFFVVVWIVSVLAHSPLHSLYVIWMLLSFGAISYLLLRLTNTTLPTLHATSH